MRVLELFSGIGGTAAAVHDRAEVVGAVDHDLRAQAVYALNWPHRREVKNLSSVKPAWLASFQADLWWMSPPCAPHGIRGAQADLDDPRSDALAHLTRCLAEVGPAHVALENVPWFADSRAWASLDAALTAAGYRFRWSAELCPSAFGIANQRRRFYAVASRAPLGEPSFLPEPVRLPDVVGPWEEALAVPPERLARFGEAFHTVDAEDPDAVTATFTRAYGNSPVYAGSYLRQRVGGAVRVRHFAPGEIGALQGFPVAFDWAGVRLRDGWKLVGNSVSVPVVRRVLSTLPELA